MEITKTDAEIILGALDRVPVQGLQSQRAVLTLSMRLQAFLNNEESNGDDVPSTSE